MKQTYFGLYVNFPIFFCPILTKFEISGHISIKSPISSFTLVCPMIAALNHESIGERERRTYERTYKADIISVEAAHLDVYFMFVIFVVFILCLLYNPPVSNIMEIRQVGAGKMHADRRTDMMKVRGAFRSYA